MLARYAGVALWLIRSFFGLGGPGVPWAGFFVPALYRVRFGSLVPSVASACPLRRRFRLPVAPHQLAWSLGRQTCRRTQQPQRSRRRASALGLLPRAAVGRRTFRVAVVTHIYSVGARTSADLSVCAAPSLCLPTAGVGAKIAKTCGNVKRSLPGHGVRVATRRAELEAPRLRVDAIPCSLWTRLLPVRLRKRSRAAHRSMLG